MAPQRELGVNEILPRRLTQLVKPRSLRRQKGLPRGQVSSIARR